MTKEFSPEQYAKKNFIKGTEHLRENIRLQKLLIEGIDKQLQATLPDEQLADVITPEQERKIIDSRGEYQYAKMCIEKLNAVAMLNVQETMLASRLHNFEKRFLPGFNEAVEVMEIGWQAYYDSFMKLKPNLDKGDAMYLLLDGYETAPQEWKDDAENKLGIFNTMKKYLKNNPGIFKKYGIMPVQ